MSIDLDSFPLLNYEKDREGPEPNQERKRKPFDSLPILSTIKKARPLALGRPAGSFPVVLFPPRERRAEEVCPARGGSVESLSR